MLFSLDSSNKNSLKQYFNFIISLAEQSWLNEYVCVQSKKEINYLSKLKKKIESDKDINELEIAILGCYIPFNNSEIIVNKLLNYKSTNILFNDLINVQIKEPLKEKELVKSITTLDVIDDSVSKKVREQYEEHPYPRWRYTDKDLSSTFLKCINTSIAPNKIDYNNKFDNPSVLIAGCGTGSHPISTTRYKNADILAVDLSLTSLAYAKRKTEELGHKNIEYLHADILQLKKLNKKFDIIESAGTLHHMEDPVKGLKVLLDILEPHGFLRLGLYSEIARQGVVAAREFIKKKNYKNTSKDIKICRQDILDQKENPLLQKLTYTSDFHSTSTVRDLLFHVQEQRFTIPQISKILKDLDLEFLGFSFSDPLIKKRFSKSFPEDKNNISLDNWHQFEINNSNIFIGMYQFWVRKI
jgi:SAM-dependent methyltransferase